MLHRQPGEAQTTRQGAQQQHDKRAQSCLPAPSLEAFVSNNGAGERCPQEPPRPDTAEAKSEANERLNISGRNNKAMKRAKS